MKYDTNKLVAVADLNDGVLVYTQDPGPCGHCRELKNEFVNVNGRTVCGECYEKEKRAA